MKIGIDANYLQFANYQAGLYQYAIHLIMGLEEIDRHNEYILFFLIDGGGGNKIRLSKDTNFNLTLKNKFVGFLIGHFHFYQIFCRFHLF